MKTFYIFMCCLFPIFVYGEGHQQTEVADGTYTFQKGTFIIYKYGTQAEVKRYTIDDPSLVKKTDIYFQNIFLEATINNGILSSCILPYSVYYTVKDAIELLPTKKNDADKNTNGSLPGLAPYSLLMNGNILTFSIRYLYGDSQYSFPLEGKLTIDLIKQK